MAILFEEMAFPDARPVDGYGPGFTRIGGEVFRGPLLCLPGGIAPWGGPDETARLIAEAASMDVLFVGMGSEMRPLPMAFRAAMEGAGLAAEPMTTPSACRTYNVLLSEGRRVGLALIPV